MNIVQRIIRRIIFSKNQRYFFDMYTHGYMYDKGYVRSLEMQEVLFQDGTESPWYNFSFIDFLENRLKPDLKLFEYGLGNSTIYFNSKLIDCYGVDHNYGWYNKIVRRLKSDSNYSLTSEENYVNAISKFGILYDIISIDGECRNLAIAKSIEFLSDSGIIILDDSERSDYSEGAILLANNGFKELAISGLKSLGRHCSSTSIFYRPNNCFNI